MAPPKHKLAQSSVYSEREENWLLATLGSILGTPMPSLTLSTRPDFPSSIGTNCHFFTCALEDEIGVHLGKCCMKIFKSFNYQNQLVLQDTHTRKAERLVDLKSTPRLTSRLTSPLSGSLYA